jgi:hypothetical protein
MLHYMTLPLCIPDCPRAPVPYMHRVETHSEASRNSIAEQERFDETEALIFTSDV